MTRHFLYRYFSKNRMKHQLITLFICAILIPVFIIGNILGILTYRRTTSHYEELSRSQVKLAHSTIVSTPYTCMPFMKRYSITQNSRNYYVLMTLILILWKPLQN